MYKHWFTRFLAFILGVKSENTPVPDPEYVQKFLYPAVSDAELAELAREKWQG